MNTESREPRLRIVVAFNACRRDLDSLALAAALAARRGGELEAVFVEELNLLNSAELPFTKEVDRIFGTERAFDSLRISRAQRLSLSQIKQELGRLTERLQVHGSIKTLRGHFVPTALACVGEIDVLVLGGRRLRPSTEYPGTGTASAAPGTAPAAQSKPVWTVSDGSEGAYAALTAAAELATGERRPLFVAVPGRPHGIAQDVQRRLASIQEFTASPSRIIEVEPFDPVTLLRRIRQTGCRMLVVARTARDLIDDATDAAEWPLVLV